MDRAAKNLRIFFGPQATLVWSFLRDIQRAERSIEIYQKMILSLETDLSEEEGKRGELVRLRSNELTDAKEALEAKEEVHKKYFAEVLEYDSQVKDIWCCLVTTLHSVFGKSKSVDEIKDLLSRKRTELEKVDETIKELRESFSLAIYQQAAAIDPIRDIRFAIDHLDKEIASCRERIGSIYGQIDQKLRFICEALSPVNFQLLLDMGLSLSDPVKFLDDAQNLTSEQQEDVPEVAEEESFDLPVSVLRGMCDEVASISKNIRLTGKGYHHRKVRSGESDSWKKRDVSFGGTKEIFSSVKHRVWTSSTSSAELQRSAEHFFEKGYQQAMTTGASNQMPERGPDRVSTKGLLHQLI
ncbi:MAG: hypothetical protein NE330_02375 [Lentisphaeraceae bacterium]|nr:hypothetical protein [Lentisphaeraceae bacterium]